MPRPRRPHLPWDEIHPTLDLHGRTADEARREAGRWLLERRSAGDRTVRIVTGRGLHSVGPPVLRGEIEALLQALKGDVVRGWQSDSGGGALRVELKRAPRATRPTAPSSRAPTVPDAGDPALRRAAEESLIELGITPTPELTRLEMRRLRASAEGRGEE